MDEYKLKAALLLATAKNKMYEDMIKEISNAEPKPNDSLTLEFMYNNNRIKIIIENIKTA